MNYNTIEKNFRKSLNIEYTEQKLFVKATEEQLNSLINLIGEEPTEVISFYKNCQPYEMPMLDCYLSLCDIEGIIEESTAIESGKYLSDYNIFVFGVTVGGDIVCFDKNDMHNGDPAVLAFSSSFCICNDYTGAVEIVDYPDDLEIEDDEVLEFNYENIVKCGHKIESSFTAFIEKLSRNEYEDIEEFIDWLTEEKMTNHEKIRNPYEAMLIENLEKGIGFPYNDIEKVDKYPIDIAKKVVRLLIENACLGQNIAVIELGRNNLQKINKEWLKKYFLDITKECIDYSDEWEYRRLLELVEATLPELKMDIINININSNNEEILEIIEDFTA